jgi:hypothetical protein
MKTHRQLEPHEVQMVQEHVDLEARIQRFQQFIQNPGNVNFSEAEIARMKAQEMAMSMYLSILSDRLAVVFKETGNG